MIIATAALLILLLYTYTGVVTANVLALMLKTGCKCIVTRYCECCDY
jgi:hypothetical protein